MQCILWRINVIPRDQDKLPYRFYWIKIYLSIDNLLLRMMYYMLYVLLNKMRKIYKCPIRSLVKWINKLMKIKFVLSIFIFVLIFHYLIRSLSIISKFLKKDNSIGIKKYHTLHDKTVQCFSLMVKFNIDLSSEMKRFYGIKFINAYRRWDRKYFMKGILKIPSYSLVLNCKRCLLSFFRWFTLKNF